MKCIICGHDIPDNSAFCNVCGGSQSSHREEKPSASQSGTIENCQSHASVTPDVSNIEDTESKSNKVSNKKNTIITVAILAAVIICIVIYSFVSQMLERNATFNEAVDEMTNGNIYQAKRAFESIQEYKSDEIEDAVYKRVVSLCEADDYEAANDLLWIFYDLLADDVRDKFEQVVDYSEAIYLSETGEDYYRAYGLFNGLGDYEDSAERANEIYENHTEVFYQNAVYRYEEENWYHDIWNLTKEWFIKLGDYKDSAEYLKKMEFVEAMNDIYDDGNYYYIFSRFDFTRYKKTASGVYEEDSMMSEKMRILPYQDGYCMYRGSSEQGTAYIMSDDNAVMIAAHIEDGNVVINDGDDATQRTLRRTSVSIRAQRDPQIGMTAEEVRLSSWGEPYKINKSTYSWGTSEQWCYSGYKYIYLDNGIVTSIQE